jgi:ketosteroid isomerase-like protein
MERTSGDAEQIDHVELLELEHEGWQALCTGKGKGAEFYAATMTDDAVMVLADGSVLDHDEVLSSLRESPPWDTYAIDDPVVVPVTDVVRALVYRGTARRGDVDFSGTMTSVYVQTADGWRLALYQQTPSA